MMTNVRQKCIQLLLCSYLTSFVLGSVAVQPIVIRNLARGATLKCMADLCGGLPFEVWKSSVVLENIRANQEGGGREPRSDIQVLQQVLEDGGLKGLWSGCPARMAEGIFSGAVLLAAKETLRKALTASPIPLPPSAIGFVAGAGGGAAQAIVMAPTSLLVTAVATARKDSNDGGGFSVLGVARDVWTRKGLRGMYTGAPAVAMRQATNWASRQGFTELVRPKIQIGGVPGEIIAGLVGGTLSCWNTPFEVARIETQSRTIINSSVVSTNNGISRKKAQITSGDDSYHPNLIETMGDVVRNRGVAGLYTGIGPRIAQSCYQTVFLVCIPRLLS